MSAVLASLRAASPMLAAKLSAALIREQNAMLDDALPVLHQDDDPAQGLRGSHSATSRVRAASSSLIRPARSASRLALHKLAAGRQDQPLQTRLSRPLRSGSRRPANLVVSVIFFRTTATVCIVDGAGGAWGSTAARTRGRSGHDGLPAKPKRLAQCLLQPANRAQRHTRCADKL